jgi:hypothetical protein
LRPLTWAIAAAIEATAAVPLTLAHAPDQVDGVLALIEHAAVRGGNQRGSRRGLKRVRRTKKEKRQPTDTDAAARQEDFCSLSDLSDVLTS